MLSTRQLTVQQEGHLVLRVKDKRVVNVETCISEAMELQKSFDKLVSLQLKTLMQSPDSENEEDTQAITYFEDPKLIENVSIMKECKFNCLSS